ncbi:MAG: cytochrome C, partial [Chromatiaceae bacterium]
QKLYRVSTGHGGVMCEGCHGATHAEWDQDGSPLKNDNVTGNQLQGHSGTVSECSTCHVTSAMSSNTQSGPHGMHLVNDSRFWQQSHKDMAKAENGKANGGTCGACHGADHLGTVLSRTPVDRSFSVEGTNRTVLAGDPVACNLCHSVSKSFGR